MSFFNGETLKTDAVSHTNELIINKCKWKWKQKIRMQSENNKRPEQQTTNNKTNKHKHKFLRLGFVLLRSGASLPPIFSEKSNC